MRRFGTGVVDAGGSSFVAICASGAEVGTAAAVDEEEAGGSCLVRLFATAEVVVTTLVLVMVEVLMLVVVDRTVLEAMLLVEVEVAKMSTWAPGV